MKVIINCCIAITLITLALFVGGSTEVQAATCTVTNLNDSGPGSLREAINCANGNPGPDTIVFSVAGTINVLSQLPSLSDATGGTTIDGTTAPGYAGAPGVAVRGGGLKITSAHNEVRALQMRGSGSGYGIEISGNSASENVITGCYIGTDGSTALKWTIGVRIYNAPKNCIGTDGDGVGDEAERNVISGNHQGVYIQGSLATGNVVAGNYIGTDATGSVAVPNTANGIAIDGAADNRIGTGGDGVGDEAERNVISGNGDGIGIWGTGTVVAGNYIGINAAGTGACPNYNGLAVHGANTRIGTDGNSIADAAERNIISGNTGRGVFLSQYAGNTVIAGNYIGTDAEGSTAIGNVYPGVEAVSGIAGLRIGTDGDGVADDAERNVISGNNKHGIAIAPGSSDVIVAGNYIGTDVSGTLALGNGGGTTGERGGIMVGSGRVGTNADGNNDDAERNVISGNHGYGIRATGKTGIVIAGNYIGTQVTRAALGNDNHGVYILDGANHVIGGTNPAAANTIAFNGGDGVAVLWSECKNNSIRLNSIHSNGGLGIDLDGDGVNANDPGDADTLANNLQNFPVITAATFDGTNTTINGTVNSAANTTFVIDLYSNTVGDPSGYGEGETYLGTTTSLTDGTGNGTWTLVVAGDVIGLVLSATATDPTGNTSEFSSPQPRNTAPVAVNDSYGTDEDTTLTVAAPGVLGNDSDAENDPLSAVLVSDVSHGTLTLNANGSFTYTPNANFNGTDTFTYKANDGTSDSNVATVSITVNPVNDPPVANDDSYSTDEDTVLAVAGPGVLGNDSDVENDPLSAVLISDVLHGTLTLNANGSFTYTPNANFNGTDTFTYKANDGTSDSNVATVSITVNPVNDPPVAVDDAYSVDEDNALTVAAPGVLGNDSDADGDPLTVVLVTDVSNGTLTLSSDGSFTYTPDVNFNGTDSFTYKANDGADDSNITTVTITVNSVNDAPVANNDSASTDEDTAVTINVLTNDTDVDGDTLTVASVTQPSNGSVTNNGSDVTYTPDADYCGNDSFTYTVSDGNGGMDTATVDVTVVCVNDAPVAVDDSASTNEDTGVTIDVLANDTDVDGDALTVASVTQGMNGSVINNGSDVTYTPDADFCGSDSFTYTVSDGNGGTDTATVNVTVACVNDTPVAEDDTYGVDEDDTLTMAAPGVLDNDSDVDGDPLTAVLVTDVSNGTLSLNSDGSFTYTADPDFNGTDSFTYKANDGTNDSNIATVTITVSPVDDAPVANNDSATTDEDTAVTIDVLANDTDVDGDTLTVASVTQPSNGSVASNGTDVTYAPNADYCGSDSFTYTVSDGNDGMDTATVEVTVTCVNDAPVAEDDAYSVNEDDTLTVAAPGVLDNDNDVEGDTLTAVLVTGTSDGALTLNAGGSFTYAPNPDFNDTDTFTYKASDGTDDSNIATVTITVNPVADAPVSADDTYGVDEDDALTVAAPGVLTNDSDADGDTLTAILINGPSDGTLTFNADGSFTYTPDTNFNGTDSFTYKANDGSLDSNKATVTITVNPINDAPVAVDDAATTQEDTLVTLNVLSNDSDLDADVLTVGSVTPPSNGSVTNNVSDVTYTPDTDFCGSDSFTYTASDGNGGTDTAAVDVTVTCVNDAPVAKDDAYSVDEDNTLTMTALGVLANDRDVEGDALTAVLVNGPSDGTLILNADGSFTYTSDADFNGTDTFTYKASDGTDDSNIATVTIIVYQVNDAPVAADDTASTDEDIPVDIDVLANDSDVDGDSLTVASVTQPSHGTVTNNGTDVTYTPETGFAGTDSFTYTVSDGNGGTDTAAVTVTVIPANTPPTADAGGPYSVDEGGSVIVTASGSDPEGDPLTFAWDLDNDGTFETPGQSVTFSAAGLDGPSSHTIAVQVTDSGGLSATDQATVDVLNVAPTVGQITASLDPVQVNTTINASADFTDPGVLDTHTAEWNWGDDSTSPGVVNEANGSGSVTGSHTYTTPGVYTVKLTVTDKDGDSDESIFQFVVVYDPEGGFVTGGGWINSPEGACRLTEACIGATGKANFGFVSKYKKGANVPTGETVFQFKAGNLNFHSDSYEWLVVAGHKAMYKGVGTINGAGNYGFMLTAIDEKLTPSTDVDLFRIKIWDKDNDDTIVYDNQMRAADDADPTTAIGGGSIVIHKQ